MKKKILKILESPKAVIPVTFLIVLVLGFFVFKYVGYAPKNSELTDLVNTEVKNGEVIDLAFPKTGRVNMVYVKQGDIVKKGQILANLDYTDVRGALEIAKANYQKIINGATGVDIDVAKASVGTAQVNLDTVTKQQNLAVESAYRNLLNSIPEAVPEGNIDNYVAPTITGNYILGKEGDIKININYTSGNVLFSVSGVAGGEDGVVSSSTAQPIGNSGLYIKFPSATNANANVSSWIITIPNKKAANYITNYNAYQSALESQKRLVDIAKATFDQANTVLLQKISSARPEDVAAATGALAVAQGAYDNNFIYAPTDGEIEVVNIGVGEIALANSRVISMVAKK